MRFQAFVVLGLVSVVGCGGGSGATSADLKKITGTDVIKVVPVAGKVIVDGEPAVNAFVTLHAADGKKLDAKTGHDGGFTFTTYKAGDGVPPGEYKVTIEMIPVKKKKAELVAVGTDKLNGKYSDPAKSEFTLSVVAGTPKQDLKYELTSK